MDRVAQELAERSSPCALCLTMLQPMPYAVPYLVEMRSYPRFEHAERELNWVEIGRVWREIAYLASMSPDELLYARIAVYRGVIHDDNAPRTWEWIAERQ